MAVWLVAGLFMYISPATNYTIIRHRVTCICDTCTVSAIRKLSKNKEKPTMPHMGPHVPKNMVYMLDLRLAMVEAHMFARLIGGFSVRHSYNSW